MNLSKKNNKIEITDTNGKKLEVSVNINGNLDFNMELITPKNMSAKEKAYFMVDDKSIVNEDTQNVYFATAKLFDDLSNALINYKDFYEIRFQETPVYNFTRQCFKIHSDKGKGNELDFIRFFRKEGSYYFVFNQNPTRFYLSKLNTRYPDFAKAFNKFYSILEKDCKSKKQNSNQQLNKAIPFSYKYRSTNSGINNG